MKTITIPVSETLDDDTIAKMRSVLEALVRPEWAMLLKFYTSQKFEIHCKGDAEPDIRVQVRK